ncbi:hypothetical protein QQF64_032273 [Cirrhinus molitorella]|uniref:Peptidase A2 domain-containing protein n=1 Tax=Cirrhinus molitorella TaxID=172907 RepID=A0ABR3MZC1_9TELE
MPVGLIGFEPWDVVNGEVSQQDPEVKDVSSKEVDVENYAEYAPFINTGIVSLAGREGEVPVKILRDTGASQSFLLEGVLPLSDQTATGKDVIIRGLVFGNDLAQGNVWGASKTIPSTKVVSSPLLANIPDECNQKFPHVFLSCAVPRAMEKQLIDSVKMYLTHYLPMLIEDESSSQKTCSDDIGMMEFIFLLKMSVKLELGLYSYRGAWMA